MDCFDRFKKKMELSGNSLKNEFLLNSRNLMEQVFHDDVSIGEHIYIWKLGLTSYQNEKEISIRFYKRKFSNANGDTVQFQTLRNTPIEVGDVLFDLSNEIYWICTEVFNIDNIHYQGKLTECNWLLKWQLQDGTIVEYPCQDMNSTQYNSGETGNRLLTIGTSQHMLTLPYDENTGSLSSPQRFYLDKNKRNPTTYIVAQNDTTSYNYGKGLCKVTVSQCAENSKSDRPDLGICDYIDVLNNTSNFSALSKIIYDTNIIKSGGDAQKFIAEFYSENGEKIDISPTWEIICDFKKYLEVKESDNEIMIGIDNDDYIDEEFKLILSDGTNETQSSLIIKIDSLL